MRKLELYLHIPFCVRKCAYCDFLSAPAEDSVREAYMARLREEIKTFAPEYRAYQVSSIFFGGGTPSVLTENQIASVMETLRQCFHIAPDAEISMECNPGTLTEAKAKTIAACGINRVSLGLQSARDEELKALGRIHTWKDFLESFDQMRRVGCRNINVDLMSALPGQTLSSWEKSLKRVTALKPEHISAYSLILEEGTEFFTKFHEEELLREKGGTPTLLPSEETERQMYMLTESFLRERGYERYEISNYAKPGFACRHNVGYWTRSNYLGFGLGASSLIENVRFHNPEELNVYLTGAFSHEDREVLDKKAQMEEFMFLGLRMTDGVSRRRFEELFGVSVDGVYGGVLRRLKEEKLIAEQAGRLRLTAKGVDVSNPVLAEFLF